MIRNARQLSGREKKAWMLAGITSLFFAAGQAAPALYLLTGTTAPSFGLTDYFFLGGFTTLMGSLLLLPQSAQHSYERLRLILDMAAGVIALFVLLWITTVGQLAAAVSRGDARSVGDLVYAIVDGLVLAGLILVLLRPARYRFDPRLLLAGLALLFSSAVDIINIGTGQVAVAGDPLSGLWLVAFAFVYLLGGIVGSTPGRRPNIEVGAVRKSGMVAVYGAVLAVVGVLIYDLTVGVASSNRAVESIGVVVLGAITVARQSAAIKENRVVLEAARNRIISSVSHELRTPLTVAIGFTDLLRTRADTLAESEKAELAVLTGESLAELSRLVSDLLMVQRGHLDRHTLRLSTVDAEDLITRAIAKHPDMTDDGVQIVAETDLKVETDPERAVQVLSLLIDNAIKYGKTPVQLRIGGRAKMVYFEVHDSGAGVPGRHQDDMWEAFERGDHRLDAQHPGTGLGLTTARAVIQALRGTIAYRSSQELGGACFEISLPRA